MPPPKITKETLIPIGVGAALILLAAGAAFTFATDQTQARAERHELKRSVDNLTETIKESGLAALPDRLQRIERDLSRLTDDSFTQKDAEILRLQLREQGVRVPTVSGSP